MSYKIFTLAVVSMGLYRRREAQVRERFKRGKKFLLKA
jgi:hypothetical protein